MKNDLLTCCQVLWDQEFQNRSEYVEYEQTVVMMLSWKESDLVKEDLDEEVTSLIKFNILLLTIFRLPTLPRCSQRIMASQ